MNKIKGYENFCKALYALFTGNTTVFAISEILGRLDTKPLWNQLGKKTTLTQFIKEGFHPIIAHHRAHQPGLQKCRPFVYKWLMSTLIILWISKNSFFINWLNRFLCICSFWFWGSPGTRGPLWPAHLDSLLPLSPDSSHGRRNRVCRRSSRRCQESVSCEQIQVLGNKQSVHVMSIQIFNGN